MRRLAPLLLLALLAPGCSHSQAKPSAARPSRHATQVIPWTMAVIPATRYVPSVPRGAHPCAGRAFFDGWSGVNSAESIYTVSIRNRSRRTCFLEGHPTIAVPHGSGPPVAVRKAVGAADAPVMPFWPPGFPHHGARFGLRPGQPGSAMIAGGGSAQCGAHPFPMTTVPSRVSFGHHGESARIRVSACRKTGTSLVVGPWSPPSQPIHREKHWPVKFALEFPRTIGTKPEFNYAVRMTNVGTSRFRFPAGSCPSFQFAFRSHWSRGDDPGTLDSTDGDSFDCHRMRPLRSGQSAVFEIQDDLAVYEPAPGRHRVIWGLGDGSRTGITLHGKVEITH